MGKIIIVSTVAAMFLVSAPLFAQTQVSGQGSKTVTETTEEPPPRTIIPEQKSTTSQTVVEQKQAPTSPTPQYQPKYEPKPAKPYNPSSYGSVKCDLPSGCEESLPSGSVTLEQLDARKGGAAPQVQPKKIEPLPPPPAPVASPAPASTQASSAVSEPIYESSKDKPVVMRHYIQGVSDKMPGYTAPATAAPTYPAATPSPAPAKTYQPPAYTPPPSAPKVAAPAAVAPSSSYGTYKSDLPGYTPEPLPPGSVRLEDVGTRGYAEPQKKKVQPQAQEVQPAPAGQMEQYEDVGPSETEVQKPPSRWK